MGHGSVLHGKRYAKARINHLAHPYQLRRINGVHNKRFVSPNKQEIHSSQGPLVGSIKMKPIPLNKLPGVEYCKRKTILNTSNIEWVDRCCNHYYGCVHGCTYPCYARLISRKSSESWNNVIVAENALEIIEQEIPILKERGHAEDEILLCSMTDPYQPIEQKQMLTQKIIEVLIRENMHFKILTKSPLIARDYPLISTAKHARVGFTIITLDEEQRKIWEPFTGSIHARTTALLGAKHNWELETFVSMEPILLGVTKPLEIIEAYAEIVDLWIFGKLNYGGPNKMKEHYVLLREDIINKCEEMGLKYLIKAELQEIQHKFQTTLKSYWQY